MFIAAYTPTEMDLLIIRRKTDDEKNEEEYRERTEMVPGSFPGGLHY